jgi:caffeoyl-CoA O-methyltransferase
MKSFVADESLGDYIESVFPTEDAFLLDVRERARSAGLPDIHVGGADGLHLSALVALSGARKVVEIGTLAGYSGVRIARALPPDGKLWTFEFSPEHAAVAAETFRLAGVTCAEIALGPALDRLAGIEAEGPFDLVFIDADKENYGGYLDWAYHNLRVGGSVLADNVFAWGYIAPGSEVPPERAAAVEALRAFNDTIARDGRWLATILPTGEGLALAVKLR